MPGYVCGIVQDGVGYRDGKPVITLHMEAYLGAPESYDAVEIKGSPALKMKIAGGVHGDIATASIAVNSMPKVLEAAPGLHTMRDMAIPSFFGGVVALRGRAWTADGSGGAKPRGRRSGARRGGAESGSGGPRAGDSDRGSSRAKPQVNQDACGGPSGGA